MWCVVVVIDVTVLTVSTGGTDSFDSSLYYPQHCSHEPKFGGGGDHESGGAGDVKSRAIEAVVGVEGEVVGERCGKGKVILRVHLVVLSHSIHSILTSNIQHPPSLFLCSLSHSLSLCLLTCSLLSF